MLRKNLQIDLSAGFFTDGTVSRPPWNDSGRHRSLLSFQAVQFGMAFTHEFKLFMI